MKLTNHLIADIWPGSGVAVLDFNGDGFEDLFVADGVRSILYKNDGRGHFTDVTVETGLAKPDGSGIAATGVAAGDVDGDGRPDLFVTDAFGPARLFRDRGDGTFEETTSGSGVSVIGNARSAAFADVDGDGDLDLFVCVTGDYYNQMPDPPYDANDGKPSHLYMNDGHGYFTDASAAWGIAKTTRWSLSSIFADYDGDGRPDLLVTNDFGLKNLYRNDGEDASWTRPRRLERKSAPTGCREPSRTSTETVSSTSTRRAPTPSGTSSTNIPHCRSASPAACSCRSRSAGWKRCPPATRSSSRNRTTPLRTRPRARAPRTPAGTGAPSPPTSTTTPGPTSTPRTACGETAATTTASSSSGGSRSRYWDDYVAGTKTFDRKGAGIAGIERDRYFRNRSGDPTRSPADDLFEERSFLEGLDLETNGRAVVAFDANNDGALDVYIRSVQSPEALFLSTRRANEHYLRIKFRGTPGRDNRDGIGSRLTAVLPGGRRLILETGNTSGYLSTGSPIAHLGLGPATRLDSLTIRWPSGKLQTLGPIAPVDRTILVDEESGILLPGPTPPTP